MEAETEEYVFEKEFGDSFGIDGFVTRSENDPLRKAMVDHDQQGIKAGGRREAGNKVNRQLLKRARAGGRQRAERRDGWVGIHLHLLTEGTASNEATDERRHTRPPVVPGKEGVSTKETTMTGGWRGMYRRDEIVACGGRYIKTIFEIQ